MALLKGGAIGRHRELENSRGLGVRCRLTLACSVNTNHEHGKARTQLDAIRMAMKTGKDGNYALQQRRK